MGNFMKWGRGLRLVMANLASGAAVTWYVMQIARSMGWLADVGAKWATLVAAA